MTITEKTGLCTCGLCNDGKKYTPTGLNNHLEKVHKRHICHLCGTDYSVQYEMFRTLHNCRGAEIRI